MVPARPRARRELPWSERHRPRHLGEVIGNTDQVRRIAEWLRDWDDVVLRGKAKEPPPEKKEAWQKFQQAPENVNARAVLISGPPGIGKTTTCSLVARCNPRYKLMEFNASDARGKNIIESMSQSLAGNHTLKFGAGGSSSIERAVIIMDECDGMAGGGDKGGMQALINMIKTTKNPIICICNDRADQQVRNLATHCYDVKFRRPDNAAVARRIAHILEGEGRRVDQAALEAVVEACGQDIRQVINQIQFLGSAAAAGACSQKDAQVMVTPFDACSKLLSRSKGRFGSRDMTLAQRMDLFYIDADIMPLMIHENYLRPLEKRGLSGDGSDLAKCAQAAELVALGDSLASGWELQSVTGIVGSLYPAFLAATDEPFPRPSFPAWLQKRAPTAKAERIAQEVHARVRPATTCSGRGLVTAGYHDVLYRRLLKPLQTGCAQECATALTAYGLTREFFTDQAPILRQPLQMEDMYRKVEGRLKHALLQELQNLAQQPAPKRRRAADGEGGQVRRRRASLGDEDTQGPADGADEGEGAAAEDGEDDAGLVRRRKVEKRGVAKSQTGKVTKAGGAGRVAASSLAGWRTKPATAAGGSGDQDAGAAHDGADASAGKAKKGTLVLRYIEGHTCAVRRKVHMRDLLGPWVLF